MNDFDLIGTAMKKIAETHGMELQARALDFMNDLETSGLVVPQGPIIWPIRGRNDIATILAAFAHKLTKSMVLLCETNPWTGLTVLGAYTTDQLAREAMRSHRLAGMGHKSKYYIVPCPLDNAEPEFPLYPRLHPVLPPELIEYRALANKKYAEGLTADEEIRFIALGQEVDEWLEPEDMKLVARLEELRKR